MSFCFFAQPSDCNKPMFYVLILSSLILSWVEAWIFDTKVKLLLIHNKLLLCCGSILSLPGLNCIFFWLKLIFLLYYGPTLIKLCFQYFTCYFLYASGNSFRSWSWTATSPRYGTALFLMWLVFWLISMAIHVGISMLGGGKKNTQFIETVVCPGFVSSIRIFNLVAGLA